MVFEAAVVMSRKWDAAEAGEEIGKQIKEKMKNKPKFVMLFPTIHYKNYGGFKKLVDSFFQSLSYDAVLVGGSVSGFMLHSGCFTRGVAALAVYGDDILASAAYAENTKRDPKGAATAVSNKIIERLPKDERKNSFLFQTVSDGVVPILPIIGQKRVMYPLPASKLLIKFMDKFTTFFQYGVGRQDEVLETTSKYFPDYSILAMANFDNYKAIIDYQLCDKEVLNNSVVCIAIKTNMNVEMNTTLGLTKTDIRFDVGDMQLHGCAFGSMGEFTGTRGFLNKLNWPQDYLNEDIYSKSTYYPIGYEKDGKISAHSLGLVIGEYACFNYSFKENKDLCFYTTSGRRLLDAAIENLGMISAPKDKIRLVFGLECAIRLGMIGDKIYEVHGEVSKFLDKVPFLIVYGAGEGAKKPNAEPAYYNYSFTLVTFSEQ